MERGQGRNARTFDARFKPDAAQPAGRSGSCVASIGGARRGRREPWPANDAQKSAVALAYSQTDAAPRVVAKGRGLVAEQIIARAREHGVHRPRVSRTRLAPPAGRLDRIPPQLYIAVAELLAWIYRLESGQPVTASPFLTPLPESSGKVGASCAGRSPRRSSEQRQLLRLQRTGSITDNPG